MKKQKSWILLVELLSLVLALRLVEGASTLIDFGSKTEWKYCLNDRCEEAIEILEGVLAQDGDNEGARTILMAIDR